MRNLYVFWKSPNFRHSFFLSVFSLQENGTVLALPMTLQVLRHTGTNLGHLWAWSPRCLMATQTSPCGSSREFLCAWVMHAVVWNILEIWKIAYLNKSMFKIKLQQWVIQRGFGTEAYVWRGFMSFTLCFL